MLQPDSMNSTASQSSSSWCTGRAVRNPKSNVDATERLSKMSHPDMIDGDPCRQRIAAVDDPACQRKPAARADRRVWLVAGLVAKARLGSVIDERSRRVSGRRRRFGRGLGLVELAFGPRRAGWWRRRLPPDALRIAACNCRIFRRIAVAVSPPRSAVRDQAPFGEQAVVAGLVNRQLLLGGRAFLAASIHNSDASMIRSLVLEPLDTENRHRVRLAARLASSSAEPSDGQLGAGIVSLQPGASQRPTAAIAGAGLLRLVGLGKFEA